MATYIASKLHAITELGLLEEKEANPETPLVATLA